MWKITSAKKNMDFKTALKEIKENKAKNVLKVDLRQREVNMNALYQKLSELQNKYKDNLIFIEQNDNLVRLFYTNFHHYSNSLTLKYNFLLLIEL